MLKPRSDASRQHPNVVLNMREFSYLRENVKVKKLGHGYRIPLDS